MPRLVPGTVPVTADVSQPVTHNIDAGSVLGDSAVAGEVGELLSAVLAVGSATSLVTATPKTVVSLALTPGDWDVEGVVNFLPAGTTSITQLGTGIGTVDNTFGADNTYSSEHMAAVVPTAIAQRMVTPVLRFSVSVATTIYLIASATFTVAALTAYGTIRARRQR